ncbi:rRNA maturation RNase YbeY [Mesomycoplasma hyopneumoniae]|uniref:Endoribonuclease YbeY n=2 Tax=Mesomycoplasma hyopneumoniae (strain 168) TaxID=907287 RepID=E4QSF1_MESH1|nr:rRNA maturation RNase YbeY [Mesomycoplasma hyopneumoniae]ADQ90362.1 Putative metalloprotease [Mesomycoplasma hyopneumoniae 168]AGM21929.1 Putative metalloprotease [Mesomycoplasma hyopneumoniae 168-L]OWY73954.1 rRNA maturation RNase YbeY [Mesomycoplasma hyopneumoniae]
MKAKINFLNQSRIKFKYLKLFRKIFKLLVEKEQITGEISLDLMLITQRKAQKLAIKFKSINYIPDVLSFPSNLIIAKKNFRLHFLGEIFMTPAKIIKQANEYGHSEEREFSYLFVHSIYHLLGFDHQDEKTNKLMDEKVENILINLGINR